MKINNAIDYLQSQHTEEYELEARRLRKYDRFIREISPKLEREEILFYSLGKKQERSVTLKKAIAAIQQYNESRFKRERQRDTREIGIGIIKSTRRDGQRS